MAQSYSSYARPPGPQSSGKYPMTGPNYAIYGEQPGYVYNPWTDRYDPDRQQVQAYQEQTGQSDPKPKTPSTLDVVAPTALVLGAGYLATEGAKPVGQYLGDRIFGEQKVPGGPRVGGLLGKTDPTPSTTSALDTGANNLAADPASAALPAESAAPTLTSVSTNPAPSKVGGMFKPNTGSPQSQLSQGDASIGSGYAPDSSAKVIPQGETVPPGYTEVGTTDSGKIVYKTDAIPQDGSINLGNIAQGAFGAVQLYQGYQAYKEGDYVGAGTSAAAGASALGAAAGSQTAASALPIAGGIAGAYGLYKNGQYVGSAPAGGKRNSTSTIQGAAAGAGLGATVGSVLPGAGTAIGAAIGGAVGGAYGFANSYFGSSKDKYQMIRDGGRKFLQSNGLIDDKYQGTLADGSKFDFGKDGKGLAKLNFDDPRVSTGASLGDVLAAGEGFFGRSREAMSTLYTAAMTSNARDQAGVKANFDHFAAQRGFTPDAVQNELNSQFAKGNITQSELNAYSNTLAANLGRPSVPVGAPPVDNGKGIAPIQPGQTPTSTADSAKMLPLRPGQTAQQVVNSATGTVGGMLGRSRTRSPGIDKNGRRISY